MLWGVYTDYSFNGPGDFYGTTGPMGATVQDLRIRYATFATSPRGYARIYLLNFLDFVTPLLIITGQWELLEGIVAEASIAKRDFQQHRSVEQFSRSSAFLSQIETWRVFVASPARY